MNLAAAAGGAAANVAVNRMSSWLAGAGPSRQPAYDMGQMRAALPSNAPKARGRARRGRGRGKGRQGGQPRQGINTRGGSDIVVRDTEVLGSVQKGVTSYQFNPAPDGLVRLKAHENMYNRYRIKYMNIAYKSGSGTATTGNVWVGVCGGPVNKAITAGNVSKLRPSFFVPAWKNESLTLGKDIDSQRWMRCGNDSDDGVSFTLYVESAEVGLGVIQVSYEVEFQQPKPF